MLQGFSVHYCSVTQGNISRPNHAACPRCATTVAFSDTSRWWDRWLKYWAFLRIKTRQPSGLSEMRTSWEPANRTNMEEPKKVELRAIFSHISASTTTVKPQQLRPWVRSTSCGVYVELEGVPALGSTDLLPAWERD